MYSKQARLALEVSTLKFMKYSFVIYIISIILGGGRGGKSETPLLQNVPIAGFFLFFQFSSQPFYQAVLIDMKNFIPCC